MEQRFNAAGFREETWNELREIRVPQTRMSFIPTRSNEGCHHGKGPRSYRRSDERLFEEICEQLSHDPYIDASEVEIYVREGDVSLTGTVYNREMKRRAEDIVEGISGISQVENRLRTESSEPRGRPDLRSGRNETFR